MPNPSDPTDPPLIRVRLDPPLPCGMPGCGEMATTALVEPTPEQSGTWLTLPLCPTCRLRIAGTTASRPPDADS